MTNLSPWLYMRWWLPDPTVIQREILEHVSKARTPSWAIVRIRIKILTLRHMIILPLTLYWMRVTKYIILCALRGFGEWMFIIGLYAINRSIWKKNFSIISKLREIAMPFYLLHQQLLIVLLSGTLWIPYLNSIWATIFLSTITNLLVSFLVTRSPRRIMYLFGLPFKNKFVCKEEPWKLLLISSWCKRNFTSNPMSS